ncbi:hypothetical protein C0995_016354 [Termitomyces sp. Mi166|nr:hypothetical protein C0995_016354 [Termitomyces sp. Mi166\
MFTVTDTGNYAGMTMAACGHNHKFWSSINLFYVEMDDDQFEEQNSSQTDNSSPSTSQDSATGKPSHVYLHF